MRRGSYNFKRQRCCGTAMVQAYIRHGTYSASPGLERIGLYCIRCRRFEVKAESELEEAIRKYPVMEHVAAVLKPYMHTVQGLYLHGSRVRGDYGEDSDYDLLLITSDKIDEAIKNELEMYNVQLECFTLKQVMKELESVPSYLLTVLREGIPIIGADLQEQLRRKEVNDIALYAELKDCKKQLKLLKNMLKDGVDAVSKSTVLYSAATRLRRVYEIKKIYDSSTPALAEDFRGYYKGDFEQIYGLYKKVRDLPPALDESSVPEEFKHMSKSILNGFVNSVDAYIKNVYDTVAETLVEKLNLDK